jgi:tetratricopeptide (TPR) repeat protein
MNKEHDALKAEHARVRDELNDLRRKLDMERASIYREVGAAYVKREFFDEAISAYLDALKLDPQDPLTHYYLGIIYSKVGQEGQSLHYLRKYLKLHPQAENREEVLYIMSFIEDQSL